MKRYHLIKDGTGAIACIQSYFIDLAPYSSLNDNQTRVLSPHTESAYLCSLYCTDGTIKIFIFSHTALLFFNFTTNVPERLIGTLKQRKDT